jgi:hypothetical protein
MRQLEDDYKNNGKSDSKETETRATFNGAQAPDSVKLNIEDWFDQVKTTVAVM